MAGPDTLTVEPAVEPAVDGRRQRRTQNRETVLDALVSLFEEGIYQPSSGEIALRAGLSPRSLFRYFDDIDDLSRAAIERHLQAAWPLLAVNVDPAAPAPDRIRALVEARVRLFEAIGPSARAARVCAPRHPVIAAQLHETRAFLRRQLRTLFAPELAGDRAGLLHAVDALCSFETHQLLRHDHGLSVPKTAAALTQALHALLLPGGSPTP